MPVDANLEAWEETLSRASIEKPGRRIESRLARLSREKGSLSHDDSSSTRRHPDLEQPRRGDVRGT
jgi:hypothetical protein